MSFTSVSLAQAPHPHPSCRMKGRLLAAAGFEGTLGKHLLYSKQNSSECSNDSIVGQSTVVIVRLFSVNHFIQLLLNTANTAF